MFKLLYIYTSATEQKMQAVEEMAGIHIGKAVHVIFKTSRTGLNIVATRQETLVVLHTTTYNIEKILFYCL